MHFDGVNDRVQMGASTLWDNVSFATAALWFKSDTSSISSTKWLITKLNGGLTAGIGVKIDPTNLLKVYTGNTQAWHGWINITGLIDLLNWNHCGFVYDGTQPTNATKLRLWLNGIERTLTYVGPIPTTIAASATLLGIGCSNVGTVNVWDGVIDEVPIWSVADYGKIISHYGGGNGAAPDPTNLIHHWDFNQSNPSTSLPDLVGGLNGTLINFSFTPGSEWEAH